jgi:hypothetical protein
LEQLLHEGGAKSQSTTKHSARPGQGTITGRVWEIADELVAKTGSAERDAVVTACVTEGINVNTANTQYSHWKKEIWG